jgi:hypothetical protein
VYIILPHACPYNPLYFITSIIFKNSFEKLTVAQLVSKFPKRSFTCSHELAIAPYPQQNFKPAQDLPIPSHFLKIHQYQSAINSKVFQVVSFLRPMFKTPVYMHSILSMKAMA